MKWTFELNAMLKAFSYICMSIACACVKNLKQKYENSFFFQAFSYSFFQSADCIHLIHNTNKHLQLSWLFLLQQTYMVALQYVAGLRFRVKCTLEKLCQFTTMFVVMFLWQAREEWEKKCCGLKAGKRGDEKAEVKDEEDEIN